MTVHTYGAGSDRLACNDDILELTNSENPIRFLACDDWVWQAMINGFNDLDRLEDYRQAEKRYIESDSDKVRARKYIDDRERDPRTN